MFSRLDVRTKLLVMMLPAAVGLCGLAGLGVQSRLDDSSDAQRNRDAVIVAARASRFAHELQQERLYVATALATGNPTDVDVTLQTPHTDDAAEALDAALSGTLVESLVDTGDPAIVAELRGLRSALDELESARAVASQGVPVPRVVDAYTKAVSAALTNGGRLEATTGTGADARRWLAEGVESESYAAATASGLFAKDVDSAGRAALAADAKEAVDRSQMLLRSFQNYADAIAGARFENAQSSREYAAVSPYISQLARGDGAFDASSEAWAEMAVARSSRLSDVETEGYRAEIARLTDVAESADRAVVYFGAGALGSCLAVLLLAFAVSRAITTTLGRLTAAAREISREQVPALVQSLKESSLQPNRLHFTAVDTTSRDEFAEVGTALNDLGRAMIDVATEQHQSLRKGISEIFVNLARRNQTLLDRQIQFIDRLEANEENPDQLENLFRLDHLATRMRRNAESLLVLAGAEAPRRRARDVEVGDVVRVAIGEVEDFHRIALLGVEEADAAGTVAVDLAHLLAELMENGTQYSPPERTVDVVGHRSSDGGYLISVTDHGVGMTPDRISEANALLASPPPVGLALSRSLGFVVAGTLAARHGITVRLSPSASGGVTAEVSIPAALVRVPDSDDVAPTAPRATAGSGTVAGWTANGQYVDGTPFPPPSSAPVDLPAPTVFEAMPFEPVAFEIGATPPPYVPEPGEPVVAAPPISWSTERLPTAPAPSKLVDMLPEGERFDEGLYALLDRPVPASDAGPVPPPATGFDLPRRAPGASAPSADAPDAPADGAEPRTTAPMRTPDEIRNTLSRYRDGLGAGRLPEAGTDGPATPPDDPTGGPR
jgi:signal transduction histidine kinase